MATRSRGRMAVGIALVVVGLFATVAGIALVILLGPDGSVGLPPTRFIGRGVALTLPQLDVPRLPGGAQVVLDVAVKPGTDPLFVGVGPSAAVDAYLRDAPIDVIEQIDWPGAARTETLAGSARPGAPGEQPFWLASEAGDAPHLQWDAVPGDWTLVIMRVDGRVSIDATLTGEVAIAALGPIGIGLLVVAVAVLGSGVWLTVRAATRAS